MRNLLTRHLLAFLAFSRRAKLFFEMNNSNKEVLEEKLIVGCRIRIGKKYASGQVSLKEGQVIELVEGVFEEDNGLYTSDVNCPSIWNVVSSDYDSIYHLFGNNFEYFSDCEIIEEQ